MSEAMCQSSVCSVNHHFRVRKERPTMPERIDHVAIIVYDIEQALHFYRDTLGITPGEIREVN